MDLDLGTPSSAASLSPVAGKTVGATGKVARNREAWVACPGRDRAGLACGVPSTGVSGWLAASAGAVGGKVFAGELGTAGASVAGALLGCSTRSGRALGTGARNDGRGASGAPTTARERDFSALGAAADGAGSPSGAPGDGGESAAAGGGAKASLGLPWGGRPPAGEPAEALGASVSFETSNAIPWPFSRA